ncbi:MAG: EamA family transporter [Candidatus Peribacteraceae bacterium]|jgi:drug/metabolite transporter (DMT)-like permease
MLMSLLAMVFYSLEIALTDWKLSSISPRLLTFLYSTGVAIFALLTLILARETHSMPDTKQSVFVFLMIFSSFVAASAHFQALTTGTSAVTLSLTYAFMPVMASIFIAIFKFQFPSLQLIFAWILSIAALYLVGTAK